MTKEESTPWGHVKPEVFSLITENVNSGEAIVSGSTEKAERKSAKEDTISEPEVYDKVDAEIVAMIKELLETRIRPSIQEDGGDIEFRGFKEGKAFLKLRGACRTCDSSTVTLRNGIESMLQFYIPEVKGVHQVLDQEEEVALEEFAKFEEKLRQQRLSKRDDL